MAETEIPEADVALFRMLKEHGVIQRIKPSLLAAKEGYIFGACSDCDHFEDINSHFSTQIEQSPGKQRPWPAAYPGGSLWLSKSNLITEVGMAIDEVLLFSWDYAVRQKGIRSGYLFSHSPCGAAAKFGLSLFDQIELLVAAKETIEQRYSDLEDFETKCFFHVCYPKQIRKTRYLSVQKWNERIDQYRQFDYEPGRLFKTATVF